MTSQIILPLHRKDCWGQMRDVLPAFKAVTCKDSDCPPYHTYPISCTRISNLWAIIYSLSPNRSIGTWDLSVGHSGLGISPDEASPVSKGRRVPWWWGSWLHLHCQHLVSGHVHQSTFSICWISSGKPALFDDTFCPCEHVTRDLAVGSCHRSDIRSFPEG